MAASDTTISVTQGSGQLVATRTVDSQHRQKVVLGGAEDGESYVHLPAHDAADAGSPLKVGGKASQAAPSAVAANDRVNEWFSLEGQPVGVSTIEAGVLFSANASGGRRTVASAYGSSTLNNNTAQAVAAAGSGIKIYVVSVAAICTTFGAAGFLTLREGANDIFPIAYVAALGNFYTHSAPPGSFLCSTAANTALSIFYSGTTNTVIKWAVTYYTAP